MYAIMIDLKDRPCLIVGGGKVAFRKAKLLLAADANLTIIAPEIDSQFDSLITDIRYLKREYCEGDADREDWRLVIAATNLADVNQRVYADAAKRSLLVNVVDKPSLSDFITPSTFRRGKLQIAVSTQGSSPVLARRILKELEQRYSEQYTCYIELLDLMRQKIKEQVSSIEVRAKLNTMLVSSDWLERCKSEFEQVKQEMEQLIADEILGVKILC